ncbi:uncharacterized protein BXZ73DRAFT_106824 [Epithele typhae]|uniref:uncharacterized protein n=1 Tax=Epithele typhae TaxID=378194 RepID=UPI0020081FD6|nr:uncharacterized protein BXZ73DRAFT_106824 [Epithele typhae]KAH9913804.1 hypothetical protein BXZ73DRAFT_106824 [Epithele typhae]
MAPSTRTKRPAPGYDSSQENQPPSEDENHDEEPQVQPREKRRRKLTEKQRQADINDDEQTEARLKRQLQKHRKKMKTKKQGVEVNDDNEDSMGPESEDDEVDSSGVVLRSNGMRAKVRERYETPQHPVPAMHITRREGHASLRTAVAATTSCLATTLTPSALVFPIAWT